MVFSAMPKSSSACLCRTSFFSDLLGFVDMQACVRLRTTVALGYVKKVADDGA